MRVAWMWIRSLFFKVGFSIRFRSLWFEWYILWNTSYVMIFQWFSFKRRRNYFDLGPKMSVYAYVSDHADSHGVYIYALRYLKHPSIRSLPSKRPQPLFLKCQNKPPYYSKRFIRSVRLYHAEKSLSMPYNSLYHQS